MKRRCVYRCRCLFLTTNAFPGNTARHDLWLRRMSDLHQNLLGGGPRAATHPNHSPWLVADWNLETKGLFVANKVLDCGFPFNAFWVLLLLTGSSGRHDEERMTWRSYLCTALHRKISNKQGRRMSGCSNSQVVVLFALWSEFLFTTRAAGNDTKSYLKTDRQLRNCCSYFLFWCFTLVLHDFNDTHSSHSIRYVFMYVIAVTQIFYLSMQWYLPILDGIKAITNRRRFRFIIGWHGNVRQRKVREDVNTHPQHLTVESKSVFEKTEGTTFHSPARATHDAIIQKVMSHECIYYCYRQRWSQLFYKK